MALAQLAGVVYYFNGEWFDAVAPIQRGPNVTSSRGRCAQHLHDTRATWRTSYANLARNICATYAPDSRRITIRRMRVTSANPTQMLRATTNVTFGHLCMWISYVLGVRKTAWWGPGQFVASTPDPGHYSDHQASASTSPHLSQTLHLEQIEKTKCIVEHRGGRDNNHHLGQNSGRNVNKNTCVCTCVFACIEMSSWLDPVRDHGDGVTWSSQNTQSRAI
jgi:hypothetical protein